MHSDSEGRGSHSPGFPFTEEEQAGPGGHLSSVQYLFCQLGKHPENVFRGTNRNLDPGPVKY